MKGLIIFLLVVALVVGIAFMAIVFTPMPGGKYPYGINNTDPKSSLDNLSPDGKNMAYAGIGLIVGGFVGLGLMIKFGGR